MIEFLRKLENRGIKIARELDSYHQINKFTVFTLIVYGVVVHCDRMRFSVHSPFIEKSMAE